MTHPNETQIGGNHYKGRDFQPWDWPLHGVGYYETSAIAYVVRFREKGGLEDLYKVGHYIDKISFHFEANEYGPSVAAQSVPGCMIRRFNRLNLCDRWQGEIVQCLVSWTDENDLIDARRALEELIQCVKDDQFKLSKIVDDSIKKKPVIDRDDLMKSGIISNARITDVRIDDEPIEPHVAAAQDARVYTQAEVDAILSRAVAAPPEPEKQPFRALPPTRFPKSWDKEDGTHIKDE